MSGIETDCECYGVGCWFCFDASEEDGTDDDEWAALEFAARLSDEPGSEG